MNELRQLMNEINHKYLHQRRVYEEKLTDMQSKLNDMKRESTLKDEKLARLDEKLVRLEAENAKLRQLDESRRVTTKPNYVATTSKKNYVDAETMTDSWNVLLEEELKERLEAFVELCRDVSNANGGLLPETFQNASIYSQNDDGRVSVETGNEFGSLIHSVQFKNVSPQRRRRRQNALKSSEQQIDQLERTLTQHYDELTADASKLLKNFSINDENSARNVY